MLLTLNYTFILYQSLPVWKGMHETCVWRLSVCVGVVKESMGFINAMTSGVVEVILTYSSMVFPFFLAPVVR